MEAARKAKAAARPAVKKVSKAFYGTMITDSGGFQSKNNRIKQ